MGIGVQPVCCRRWYALTAKGWLLDFDNLSSTLSNPRQTGLGEWPGGAPYDQGFSLTWNPRESALWTLVWNEANSDDQDIYKLNPDDGATELVRATTQPGVPELAKTVMVDDLRGLAAGEDGRMWGVLCTALALLGAAVPYVISQTGNLTYLAGASSIITGSAQSLAWAADALYVYVTNGTGLRSINPDTGTVTAVSDVLPQENGFPAAMDYFEGKLYVFYGDTVKWGSYDLAHDRWTDGPALAWPAAGDWSLYGRITGLAIED